MTSFHRSTVFSCLMFCLAIGAEAQVYDASNDFSIANNPNGVWSYGFTDTLSSNLILDTVSIADPRGIDAWVGNRAGDGNPSVTHNRTNDPVIVGSVTWLPNQIILHPGPSGEYSTIRWTVPATGRFTFDAGFIGQDGATTDVHILKNGVSLFSDSINGYGNAKSYFETLSFETNDLIDIKVGFGGNAFFSDSTGVRARITAVPAPGALITLLIGAVPGAAVLLRRRRK